MLRIEEGVQEEVVRALEGEGHDSWLARKIYLDRARVSKLVMKLCLRFLLSAPDVC
jgi:hypothetical protein